MYIPEDAEVFTAKGRKVAIIYRRMREGVQEDNWGFTIKESFMFIEQRNNDYRARS